MWNYTILLLFCFIQLYQSVVTAFSSTDPSRPNFHQVLQRVGKTVFRPGGTEATDTLHGWASLNPDSNVLELASGLGTGGMALAERFHCHVTLTDTDESRLHKAHDVAIQRGLQDLIEIKTLDMNHLDQGLDETDHYDAAIVEASLTHFADSQKLGLIQELSKHTDEILLHEVVLQTDDDPRQIKQHVGEALAVGFHPMTLDGWKELLSKCGFEISELEHGSLRLLNPSSMFRDEGLTGIARIAWNLATQQDLRDRVVETKRVIDNHRDSLGYMILRAVRKE